jgi:hypothetical protein
MNHRLMTNEKYSSTFYKVWGPFVHNLHCIKDGPSKFVRVKNIIWLLPSDGENSSYGPRNFIWGRYINRVAAHTL